MEQQQNQTLQKPPVDIYNLNMSNYRKKRKNVSLEHIKKIKLVEKQQKAKVKEIIFQIDTKIKEGKYTNAFRSIQSQLMQKWLDVDCEMQLIYRIVYISVKEIECYFYRERTKLIKWVPIWLKIGQDHLEYLAILLQENYCVKRELDFYDVFFRFNFIVYEYLRIQTKKYEALIVIENCFKFMDNIKENPNLKDKYNLIIQFAKLYCIKGSIFFETKQFELSKKMYTISFNMMIQNYDTILKSNKFQSQIPSKIAIDLENTFNMQIINCLNFSRVYEQTQEYNLMREYLLLAQYYSQNCLQFLDSENIQKTVIKTLKHYDTLYRQKFREDFEIYYLLSKIYPKKVKKEFQIEISNSEDYRLYQKFGYKNLNDNLLIFPKSQPKDQQLANEINSKNDYSFTQPLVKKQGGNQLQKHPQQQVQKKLSLHNINIQQFDMNQSGNTNIEINQENQQKLQIQQQSKYIQSTQNQNSISKTNENINFTSINASQATTAANTQRKLQNNSKFQTQSQESLINPFTITNNNFQNNSTVEENFSFCQENKRKNTSNHEFARVQQQNRNLNRCSSARYFRNSQIQKLNTQESQTNSIKQRQNSVDSLSQKDNNSNIEYNCNQNKNLSFQSASFTKLQKNHSTHNISKFKQQSIIDLKKQQQQQQQNFFDQSEEQFNNSQFVKEKIQPWYKNTPKTLQRRKKQLTQIERLLLGNNEDFVYDDPKCLSTTKYFQDLNPNVQETQSYKNKVESNWSYYKEYILKQEPIIPENKQGVLNLDYFFEQLVRQKIKASSDYKSYKENISDFIYQMQENKFDKNEFSNCYKNLLFKKEFGDGKFYDYKSPHSVEQFEGAIENERKNNIKYKFLNQGRDLIRKYTSYYRNLYLKQNEIMNATDDKIQDNQNDQHQQEMENQFQIQQQKEKEKQKTKEKEVEKKKSISIQQPNIQNEIRKKNMSFLDKNMNKNMHKRPSFIQKHFRQIAESPKHDSNSQGHLFFPSKRQSIDYVKQDEINNKNSTLLNQQRRKVDIKEFWKSDRVQQNQQKQNENINNQIVQNKTNIQSKEKKIRRNIREEIFRKTKVKMRFFNDMHMFISQEQTQQNMQKYENFLKRNHSFSATDNINQQNNNQQTTHKLTNSQSTKALNNKSFKPNQITNNIDNLESSGFMVDNEQYQNNQERIKQMALKSQDEHFDLTEKIFDQKMMLKQKQKMLLEQKRQQRLEILAQKNPIKVFQEDYEHFSKTIQEKFKIQREQEEIERLKVKVNQDVLF